MKKTLYLVFSGLFGLALLLPLFQMPVSGAITSCQEKSLQFLSDVAMLDLSKYNVTFGKYETSQYVGAYREEMYYTLQTNDSYMVAHVTYLNAIFSNCLLGWREGTPIYTQPQPTNLVEVVKGVLERYQVYIGSLRYQQMRAMLDLVNKAETTVVTSGDWKLEVTVHNSRNIGFRWFYLVGDTGTALFSIHLQDGHIYTVGDDTGLFSVSDAPLVVSSEQAVAIAVERALNCSWNVKDGNGDLQTVKAEGLSTAPPLVWSLFYNIRDSFVYYPFWRVDVWLDKVYPGGVFFVSVGIWADTGEVKYVTPLGGGGGGGSSDTPASSPSSGTPPSPSMPDSASLPDSTTPPDSASSSDSVAPPSQQPSDTSAPAGSSATENSSPANQVPAVAVAAAAAAGVIATATALYLKKKRAGPQ